MFCDFKTFSDIVPVSYTHLDVYKRQPLLAAGSAFGITHLSVLMVGRIKRTVFHLAHRADCLVHTGSFAAGVSCFINDITAADRLTLFPVARFIGCPNGSWITVSYTHLDVYKRQARRRASVPHPNAPLAGPVAIRLYSYVRCSFRHIDHSFSFLCIIANRGKVCYNT